MSRVAIALLLVAGLVSALGSAGADSMEPAADGLRVRAAASERYRANRAFRFTLGGGYRDLWEAEIELPVLDLAREGGGLVPTRRFGGLQTAVLGFKAPDGRSYTFRGTDKDPSAVLGEDLRDTVIQTMVQDQMAAQHPGGPIATSVLAEAAGLLTIHERMVVMPDDPALGEFREEFGGMIGAFYEYPMPASETQPGFHGANEIIGYEDLYARLTEGGEAVDAEAYLRARLFDILIGDFDRHRKQWRWARFPGDARWKPIAEDRDMAFVRYEGLGIRAASVYIPILQNYGPDYPAMKGLTLHGWEQDRWLLPALSWSQWATIARDMQWRITDDVIDAAIAAMPPEYVALDGERLRDALRGRRDQLFEGARSFYEHLARRVDVQASNAAEEITVNREADGSTLVEVAARDSESAAHGPVYSRRFVPGDTRELRIYLRDGDDRVRVVGAANRIRLRVIAGSGQKVLDDSQGGGTTLYDEAGSVSVEPGRGTRVRRKPYAPPESDAGFTDIEDVPPRDWGSDIFPVPAFGYEKDVGVFIGAGVVYTRYGFRKHPWSSQHQIMAGWATEANEPRVRAKSSIRPENSNFIATLDLLFSGIETLRWYGYGNETSDDEKDSFYRVRNRVARAAPILRLFLAEDQIRLSTGTWVEKSETKGGDRLINEEDPYGSGPFGSIGAFVNVQFDTRRSLVEKAEAIILPFHENPAAGYPTSGFLIDFTGEISPEVWDVESTWGAVGGSVSTFLTAGENGRATLALRAGGRHTFGEVPYFKAATVGGSEFFSGDSTIRGFRSQRFAGDSSVYGNAELRLFIARIKLLIPGDFGIFGFGDVGRVFLDGESSRKWHPGYGGGLWFAPMTRTNAISFAVAHTTEETLVYMRFGFHF